MAWTAARSRLVSSGLLAAGVVLELSSATRPWARAWVSAQRSGTGVPVSVEVVGRDAAPATVALVLVAGACGVVALLTRAHLRRIIGILLTLAAGAGVAVSIPVVVDPAGALVESGTRLVADSAAVSAVAEATAWAWIGVIAWALPALAGTILLFLGGGGTPRGPKPSGAGIAAAAPPSDVRVAADVWEALSRGEDPT